MKSNEVLMLKVKLTRYTQWRVVGGIEAMPLSFLTSVLKEGVSGQHHAPAELIPGEGTPVTRCAEGSVDHKADWAQRVEEKSSSIGDEIPVSQSVASHCTDWATRLTNLQF
jgi:hypothetical protein